MDRPSPSHPGSSRTLYCFYHAGLSFVPFQCVIGDRGHRSSSWRVHDMDRRLFPQIQTAPSGHSESKVTKQSSLRVCNGAFGMDLMKVRIYSRTQEGTPEELGAIVLRD